MNITITITGDVHIHFPASPAGDTAVDPATIASLAERVNAAASKIQKIAETPPQTTPQDDRSNLVPTVPIDFDALQAKLSAGHNAATVLAPIVASVESLEAAAEAAVTSETQEDETAAADIAAAHEELAAVTADRDRLVEMINATPDTTAELETLVASLNDRIKAAQEKIVALQGTVPPVPTPTPDPEPTPAPVEPPPVVDPVIDLPPTDPTDVPVVDPEPTPDPVVDVPPVDVPPVDEVPTVEPEPLPAEPVDEVPPVDEAPVNDVPPPDNGGTPGNFQSRR